MPGLLRGVARTAVVAGTATAVSNRVSRRQASRWQAQEAPPPQQGYPQQGYPQQPDQSYNAPPRYEGQAYAEQGPPPEPPADPMSDRLDQLARLGELKSQGVLTEAEFETQKRRILG